jgi:hypothetical protein
MYAISGFAPLVFILSFLVNRWKRNERLLTLHDLNIECGVHNFDLNGVKNTNLVIDQTTFFKDENTILFRGCGPNINSRLNNILASHRGWFDVYFKIEKGKYIKYARGKRVGNYEAVIREDGRISYRFPVKITTDLRTPKFFLRL